MNRSLCICVLLIDVLGFACVHQDEQYQPEIPFAASAVPIDKSEGLIQLDVLVTGADGKPLSGLDRSEFTLLEQGHKQTILSFERFDGRGTVSEPPVKIIFLIDALQLPESLVREERHAVLTYLRRGGGKLEHPVSVFLLVDTGLWTVPPSTDGNALAREIEHNDVSLVRHNVGWRKGPVPAELTETASDSALKALGQIATEERTRPGRKLLLWVGPGWGIGSGAYADAAQGSPPVFGTVSWFSALLREAQLALYSFTVGEINPDVRYQAHLDGVPLPHKASYMNLYRKVLAIQSGGRVMNNSLDIVQQIESCVSDAASYYKISFDPFSADHPDEYHDLKVVIDRPEMTVHTNTGYYDQPYYSIDPIPTPRKLSLEELKQWLAASRDMSDGALAQKLSEVSLTERMSEERLSLLNDIVTGKRVRHQLRILADSSAFLDPPADEIPNEMPPDVSTQEKMLSLTSRYLRTTIRGLPDFFARQTTVRYQETPMYLEGNSLNYQPLHVTDSSTTTVRYRNGSEFVGVKPPKGHPNTPELITYGVFGPALEGIRDIIDRGSRLTWSHWEQGANGRVAVFRYSVPTDKSLRPVWLCCLPDGDGREGFLRHAGYHGEIAIDPESGNVMRLTVQADMKSTTPLTRDDISVDYGPVEIGGRTYVCPLRSITITRARAVRVLSDWGEAFRTWGPYVTMLNDISFDRYHIFRSESHILSGYVGR